jgi:c-di-AMP phosphodiesterase-like protein
MSHALRDLIQQSSNVIICGHKNADFDCIGSAICLSRICSSLHKQVCIIARTGGIEEKLEGAMKANEEILKKEVNFVTEGEAINQLQDNSLVIMTDHHNVRQSNGAKLLEQARKVVVIDHHRRSTDMGVKPVLIYIEAGASSTCELLTEMIPYMSQRTNLSDIDASFMLAGMIIDTQRWRVRTGSRTYDAASVLRKYGADPQTAYDWLRDTFDEFTVKSMAMATAERYPGGVIIAPIREKNMTRSLMSQVADSLLTIQSVQASFVIAQSGSDTCISARSGGRINVQRIMETMGGGGHLSAAAVQRPKSSVDALKAELIAAVEKYLKEEAADESDS